MTLAKVIENIEYQMNTFMNVYLSPGQWNVLLLEVDIKPSISYRVERNRRGDYVYRLKVGEAKELHAAARAALAGQVAKKLLDERTPS